MSFRSTIDSMEGIPADIGDWHLVRIFREGGRLLSKHFRAFLPAIIFFILPASVIKVMHTQFMVAGFVGPQGSTDSEPTFWTSLDLLELSHEALPKIMIVLGFSRMCQVLKDTIYVSDYIRICQILKDTIYASGYKTDERHSESLYMAVKSAVKSALTPKVDTEIAALLNERLRTTYKGKFVRVLVATSVCYMLFVVISTSGLNFTPEAVAAMGLPPWTIFLFTLFIVLITTITTSYFLVVGMVLSVWMWSPATPILP